MPALFPEIDAELKEIEIEANTYNFNAQFHDQFKARLLPYSIPTQILRESTIAWQDYKNSLGVPLRNFEKIEGHLAWTISTAAFYKAGGKPWKLNDVREGVCVIRHTDSIPYLTSGIDNWELSFNRAHSVMEIMLDNGVPAERIIVAGRGKYNPQVNNSSFLGRLINRRIEIILMPDLEQFETFLREDAE